MLRFRTSVFAIVILLLIWHFSSILVNKAFFPAPLSAFVSFYQLCLIGLIPKAFLISSLRVFVSSLIAISFAFPLGLIMSQSDKINMIFSPMIAILYPVPKVVFLPIFVVFLGLGNAPKILLISIIIFFQILVVVRDAAMNIPVEYIISMRSLTNSKLSHYVHLVIPWCLPDILTSMRVMVGTAVAVLFFAETFASFDGLGFLILDGMEKRNYSDMYAAVIAMALMGVMYYEVIAFGEKRLCSWRERGK